MKPRFWMREWPDREDNSVYSFVLLDGRSLTGQVANGEVTYLTTGEILVLPILEGASIKVTYIPWRSVMTFKKIV